MSADCSKLICMPRSSLKVSETVMPSILQSEKSRSLRGVLKKSAPLKTEAAKVSFFRRTSAQKDSLKEQLLTAEFSHCDLEKLAYAKELSHKVNSLQQLCEKSAPLPRLSVIVTRFQKLSLKLQLEKSQFFTATDKKRDCEKSQRVKRHLLNWTL